MKFRPAVGAALVIAPIIVAAAPLPTFNKPDPHEEGGGGGPSALRLPDLNFPPPVQEAAPLRASLDHQSITIRPAPPAHFNQRLLPSPPSSAESSHVQAMSRKTASLQALRPLGKQSKKSTGRPPLPVGSGPDGTAVATMRRYTALERSSSIRRKEIIRDPSLSTSQKDSLLADEKKVVSDARRKAMIHPVNQVAERNKAREKRQRRRDTGSKLADTSTSASLQYVNSKAQLDDL